MFCVYIYFNLDNQPMYVGEGSLQRAQSHWKKVRSGKRAQNWLLNERLKVFVERQLEPRVEIIIVPSKETGLNLEKELIAQYGRLNIDPDGILCNRMPSGYEHKHLREPRPQNVRDKISAAHRGIPKPKHTKEHNEKISVSLTGRTFSASHRERLSAALKGREVGPKPRNLFTLVDPTGKLRTCEQLDVFCREHGLNRKSMYNTLMRKTPVSFGKNKGWCLISSEVMKTSSD